MTPKERFLKATEDWYRFVNLDHHKDRDCHWFVGKEKVYSYGDDATDERWFVRHDGYIESDVYFVGNSEDEVMQKVAGWIEWRIKRG